MKETFKPFIGSYEVIVLYIDNHLGKGLKICQC